MKWFATPDIAYSLDYLEKPVDSDRDWFDASRHQQTRVIAVGGKGQEDIRYLHQCLPWGVELILQNRDEQGRMVTYQSSQLSVQHVDL